MKTPLNTSACLLLSVFCCTGWIFAGEAPADKDKKIVCEGTFTWGGDAKGARGVSKNKDGKCDIKVTLTPTATANEYEALFTFPWDNSNKNWKGTFKRNPTTGEASGTAEGDRKYVFKGKIVDGVVTCQHQPIKDGKEDKSEGTITFKL